MPVRSVYRAIVLWLPVLSHLHALFSVHCMWTTTLYTLCLSHDIIHMLYALSLGGYRCVVLYCAITPVDTSKCGQVLL